MRIACPAKINLTLEVLDRREDGYHALRSVMVPLELADELRIEPADSFWFRCDRDDLDTEDNLVVKAVRACAPDARVGIELRKRIPSEAGLGGGSSDAASILLAAMEGAFGAGRTCDWISLARGLGSDVPFFLAQSGALVEATGERVTAVGALPPWHVLVVKPPAAVSTAAAYAQIDRLTRPSRARASSVSLQLLTELQRGNFHAVYALLSNDFHDVILDSTPDVRTAVDALTRAGASRPLLCGSGSAVFALTETTDEIAAIAGRLSLPASYQCFRTAFRQSSAWRK